LQTQRRRELVDYPPRLGAYVIDGGEPTAQIAFDHGW